MMSWMYDEWLKTELKDVEHILKGYGAKFEKPNKNEVTLNLNPIPPTFAKIVLEEADKAFKKEYNNMYTNTTKDAYKPNYRIPTCSGIIRRNDTTRVDWTDGSKTVIVLEEGQKDLDMFHTFCIAFAKKCFGSTTNIMNVIKKCDTDAIEAARKKAVEEANKQAEEETKKLKEEMEKAAFEKAVQEKMFENAVFEEAIRRIQIREERKMNKDIVEMAVTDGSEE